MSEREPPEHAIPAASIGDTDLRVLAESHPDEAKEIARLEDLLSRGDETREEFLRLCQLLFDVGAARDSEYLLRRNLEHYEGEALYDRLFGTAKKDEFAAAIESFKSQFSAQLRLIEETHFLDSSFSCDGGQPPSNEFRLLARPCEVDISYAEQDLIEAEVVLRDLGREWARADECLSLRFGGGTWEVVEDL